MPLVSIVVPVYHNARSLAELLRRFQALAAGRPDLEFEFVFVDDGSRDDSFEGLSRLATGEPRMRLGNLSLNFGSDAALLPGLVHFRCSSFGSIAADFPAPPRPI